MTGSFDLLSSLSAGDPLVRPTDPARADEARSDTGAPPCSRRGCRADAVWALEWNNPRVHAPDRVKTWLACDAHRADLAAFLGDRGFLRRTVPLADVRPGPHADPRPGSTAP